MLVDVCNQLTGVVIGYQCIRLGLFAIGSILFIQPAENISKAMQELQVLQSYCNLQEKKKKQDLWMRDILQQATSHHRIKSLGLFVCLSPHVEVELVLMIACYQRLRLQYEGEYFQSEHTLSQYKRQGQRASNHSIGVRFYTRQPMLTLKVLTFGYSPSDFQRVRLPTSKECYVSCFIDLVTMEKLKKLTRMIGLDYSQFPNSMLRLPHNLLSLNFPNGRIWMDHLFCREAVLSKLRCNIHHKIGMISFFCNCWVPWSSI